MIPEAIAAIFALLVLVKSYDEFRRGREPLPVFLFWLATWGAVLVIAFFPGVTDWIRERILGPRAGLGTIFGIALVFLLFLNYRMYLKADRVEQDLQKLISNLAVDDFSKKHNKK